MHSVSAASILLSLAAPPEATRMLPRFHTKTHFGGGHIVNVHRFEETINGRAYLIEVSSVGSGKWRAQIARKAGGSGALMPFYGKTPDEAARQLSRWLTLANGQSARA